MSEPKHVPPRGKAKGRGNPHGDPPGKAWAALARAAGARGKGRRAGTPGRSGTADWEHAAAAAARLRKLGGGRRG